MNREQPEQSSTRRPLSRAKSAAILAAALLAGGGGLEGFTRFRVEREFREIAEASAGRLPMIDFRPGSPLVFALRPGSSGFIDGPTTNETPKTFGPLTYTINQDGYRGKRVAIAKPEKTRRVLFLGDSFTFGWGVNDDETFSSRLEVMLNAGRLDEDNRWECLNFGVTGYNTAQQWLLFGERVERYQPDLVVLFYYRNDAEPNIDTQSNPAIQYQDATSWLWDDAKARMNQWLGKDRFTTRKLAYGDPLETFRKRGVKWQRSREAFFRIASLCRERGTPFLAVIQPAFDINAPFNEEFPLLPIHREVRRWCAELEVECIDLLDHFEPDDNLRYGLRGDGHTNARGHQRIANILEPRVRTMLAALSDDDSR